MNNNTRSKFEKFTIVCNSCKTDHVEITTKNGYEDGKKQDPYIQFKCIVCGKIEKRFF